MRYVTMRVIDDPLIKKILHFSDVCVYIYHLYIIVYHNMYEYIGFTLYKIVVI